MYTGRRFRRPVVFIFVKGRDTVFYHASPTPNLSVLTPHTSNHGQPRVYFSTKRENVLVYLCNAVEKHCKEIGFIHTGSFHTWASYGFTQDGVLQLDEYYPNATRDTYQGVAGYIYSAADIGKHQPLADIPFAVTTDHPVEPSFCECIPDAYATIEKAVREGLILLRRYEENTPAKLQWIEETVRREYAQAESYPDYRHFLQGKFAFLR